MARPTRLATGSVPVVATGENASIQAETAREVLHGKNGKAGVAVVEKGSALDGKLWEKARASGRAGSGGEAATRGCSLVGAAVSGEMRCCMDGIVMGEGGRCGIRDREGVVANVQIGRIMV